MDSSTWNTWKTPGSTQEVRLTDIFWYQFIPWLYGKMFSLGWTFVSSMASYSPFLLITLLENKMEENKWKKLQQMQLRAREDYAIEELSAYKDGDEVDQYIKPDGKVKKEESEEEDEEEEEENEEHKETTLSRDVSRSLEGVPPTAAS